MRLCGAPAPDAARRNKTLDDPERPVRERDRRVSDGQGEPLSAAWAVADVDPAAAGLRSPSAEPVGEAGDPRLAVSKVRRRRRRHGRRVFAKPDGQVAPDQQVASRSRQATEHRSPVAGPAPILAEPTVAPAPARSGDGYFAALDLGTNNCRLLVAIPGRPGQFRVVDAFSRIVRLGEGLSTTGRLSQPAMDRALEALRVCGDKLRNRPIRKARLIATEACRAAANGQVFLDRVEREAGLRLEIIDRHTEARLAVSGCGPLVEHGTDAVVLFDIGGGSSEIALIDLSRRRTPRLANHIVAWTSLPVGVVSLAERFGGRNVDRTLFAAMVDHVLGLIAAFDGRDRLGAMARGAGFHLLGTSGTVTTLAGVHLGLERYDRRRVDGLWLGRADVDRMMETLLGWTFEERVANACIGADRADLVLAGCAILQAIRTYWPAERLRVADRGLREGILNDMMAEEGVWRRDAARA